MTMGILVKGDLGRSNVCGDGVRVVSVIIRERAAGFWMLRMMMVAVRW